MKNKIFKLLLVVCLVIPVGASANQVVPPALTANELQSLISTIQADFEQYAIVDQKVVNDRKGIFLREKSIKVFDAQNQLIFEVDLKNMRQLQHPQLQELLGASHFLTSYGGTIYYHLDVNR